MCVGVGIKCASACVNQRATSDIFVNCIIPYFGDRLPSVLGGF